MPTQNNETNGTPPFEMVTGKKPRKVGKTGIIIGVVVTLFLALSVAAGVLLVKQQQNIQEKAAANLCPGAEACPVAGQTTLLMSCASPNADGTPEQISCSSIANVGTIATCGSQQYCCPTQNSSWTTDLTLCSTATVTPSPTLTPTASASATPTATATASASATPYVQTTPRPIPVTGTGWPTIVGAGVGVVVIVGAILIAL
ncbi:MAG: hypothetical protein ABSC49_03775 [Candidatus Microgenomates bacterium]|jgi:hypothetical protein